MIKWTEFHSLFRIPFKYLESDVLAFAFQLEDGERRSQSCSDEYYWFSSDLTRNTWGQWCPNIPGGLNYSKTVNFTWRKHSFSDLVSHYPPSSWRLTQSIYDCKFSASVRHILCFHFWSAMEMVLVDIWQLHLLGTIDYHYEVYINNTS